MILYNFDCFTDFSRPWPSKTLFIPPTARVLTGAASTRSTRSATLVRAYFEFDQQHKLQAQTAKSSTGVDPPISWAKKEELRLGKSDIFILENSQSLSTAGHTVIAEKIAIADVSVNICDLKVDAIVNAANKYLHKRT
jgi:hypothetical protein